MRPGESRIPWSAEDIELVTRLSNEGRSRGQIAYLFAKKYPGSSRGAICGKLHRLGIKAKIPVGQRSEGPSKKSARVRPPRIQFQSSGGALVAASSAEPPCRLRPVAPPEAIPQPAGITIIDLREGVCHFPHGDPRNLDTFRYCGVRIEPGETYCLAHARRMYVTKARKPENV